MSNKVEIDLKANNKATPVISQVRASLNGLLGGVGSQAVGLTKQMGGAAVTAALGAAGLALSFKEVYAKVMEASYEAKRFIVMGKRFGMPAAEIAKLSRYAETAGLNVGTIGRGMLMLQRFANEGIGGATGQTKELIAKLGLTKEDLESVRKGGMQAFIKIREAMGSAMDEGEQMAVWQQLIGQRAFEMAEFLKKSPEEMAEASENAIGMSERVIQGLAAGQKQYAEMQAEISKLFGELAHDLSWLFGIVGWILRAMMSAVRLVRLVSVLFKSIVMYVTAFAALLLGEVNTALKLTKDATAELAETWSEVNSDLQRDAKALFGGGKDKSGEKAVSTANKVIRSFQEIAEWNEFIKKMKEDQYKLDMESAWNDEIKLDLMRERIKLLDQEAAALRRKYKDEAEFLAELAKKEMERLKVQIDYDKALEKSFSKKIDLRLKEYSLTLDERSMYQSHGMRDAGTAFYTDEMMSIMKSFAAAQAAYAKAEFTMLDPTASEDDRKAAMLGYQEAELQLKNLQLGAQKRSPNAIVDSLQSIGGGGRISAASGGVSEQQLAELRRQTGIMSDMQASLRTLAARAGGAGFGSSRNFNASSSAGVYPAREAERVAKEKREAAEAVRTAANRTAFQNKNGGYDAGSIELTDPQGQAARDAEYVRVGQEQRRKREQERARRGEGIESTQIY